MGELGVSAPGAAQQIDSRPLTGHQKSMIGLVAVANISEFFDMFLVGFVVTLLTKPWKLTGFEAAVIFACSGLGTVVGAVLWGRLADRIGRRSAFFWCTLTFVGFTFLSIFTPDRGWWILALLRVGVGVGVGGLNITSIPYVQEFVPARQRGLLAGMASVFIPLGLLLGSLASKYLADSLGGWRGLIGLGVLPVLLLLWVRQMPESPRFLQTHRRPDEARASYAWALEVPESEVGSLPPVETTTKTAYGVLFSTYRKPLAIITLGSFCFILGSSTIQSWGTTLLASGYGFSTSEVFTLFIYVSIADCLGRLGSAWLGDIIGRRNVLLIFGGLGAFGCLLAGAADTGTVFFTGVAIAMTFGDGAFGILNAFGAEQFPNEARSSGLGLGYGIGASAKIFGPMILGTLIGGNAIKLNVTRDAVPPAFYLFAALLVVGALIYQFARETKAVSLEEV